jgi:hypothetical protein
MPFGVAAMFLAMLALATIYAMFSQSRQTGYVRGAQDSVLIGVFSVGSFVVHNYVNLNIGLKLTAEQAVACFSEWLARGLCSE